MAKMGVQTDTVKVQIWWLHSHCQTPTQTCLQALSNKDTSLSQYDMEFNDKGSSNPVICFHSR